MASASFEDYEDSQIERVEAFKKRLEAERGEAVSLEEAAREWVVQFAEFARENCSGPE